MGTLPLVSQPLRRLPGPESQRVCAVEELELGILVGLPVLINQRLDNLPAVVDQPLAHVAHKRSAGGKTGRPPSGLGGAGAANQLQRCLAIERRNVSEQPACGGVLHPHDCRTTAGTDHDTKLPNMVSDVAPVSTTRSVISVTTSLRSWLFGLANYQCPASSSPAGSSFSVIRSMAIDRLAMQPQRALGCRRSPACGRG